MTDNKKKRRPLDNQRIDINDSKERANWTKSFKINEAKLKELVKENGTSAKKVKEALDKEKNVQKSKPAQKKKTK